MALVDVLSFQVTDSAGKVKAVPVYVASGGTVADLQTLANVIGPALDAAIDGKVTEITATIALAVNGTIKASPVVGNMVREGALLVYSADDTNYKHSVYIPTWENAGFTDNDALETGVYDTLQDAILATADRQGNDLAALIDGKRTFRK